MAENVTPVTLEVKDFAAREVLLVDYKFNQETDVEGQMSGIPRGGKIQVRVKALNDGTPDLLAGSHRSSRLHREVPEHHRRQGHEAAEGYRLLLCEVQGVLGRRRGALRGYRDCVPEARERSRELRESLEVIP